MESERNKITQLTARVNSDTSLESNGSKKEYSTIEEFLKFISPIAFSICFMSCKNRDDAHDIVQSSMCKLVEKYRNNAQSQWKPLFYTILRNKLNDFHRKRLLLGRFFVEVDNDLEQIDNQNHTSQSMVNNFSANNPDILMDREKRISLLMSSIAALPNRQQQAFIFRYLEGYSTNQTALAMNCSEGSVKTHLSRANQKLKFLLKDIYYD
jgi:RNA polymerase sigma-70 factor (ECF subfamily)